MTIKEYLGKFGVKAPILPKTTEVYQSSYNGALSKDTWKKTDDKHNAEVEGTDIFVLLKKSSFDAFQKEYEEYEEYVSGVEGRVLKEKNSADKETSKNDKAEIKIQSLEARVKRLEEELAESEEREQWASERVEKEAELNRNLIRIAKERANTDRKMDKEGPGIKLLDYQEYIYRYRHEVDGDMVTQNVDLFKIRYQFPLDCSMSIDIAEDMLFSAHEKDQLGLSYILLGDRTMEETLDKIYDFIKQNSDEKETTVITPENDELGLASIKVKLAEKKKIKEQKKTEKQVDPFNVFDEGMIYSWSFKCNVQSGYWEVTLVSDRVPEVRPELREKYSGDKKNVGRNRTKTNRAVSE